MTNKPIAFLPFSLPSPPSLCRREAGEKEKETRKRAEYDGKGEDIPALSIFLFLLFFFNWDNQQASLQRREASYGLEVGRLGCREPSIVTNIV